MKWLEELVESLLGSANLVLWGSFALVFLAGLGVVNLSISPDNRAFYGSDNVHYQRLLEFEDSFDVNSVIAFAIHSNQPITESVVFRDALRWLESQSPAIRNFVKSTSISSLPQAFGEGDELVISRLLDAVCQEVCDSSKTHLLRSENVAGRFISRDFKTTVLYVVVDVDVDVPNEVTDTQRSAEELLQKFRDKFPTLEILMTGAVPMMQAFVDTAAADSVTVVGLAFVVILVFISLSLGSFSLGLLLFVTGLLSAAVSLGIAGWAGLTLNTATSITPIVVFTLVVAGAMHLVVHYLQRNSDFGVHAPGNLRASILAQFIPMLVATLTSAVSLLSLVFVTSPPIRELGVLSAIGVVAGFFLSFSFLGLMLPRLKLSAGGGVHQTVRQFLNNYVREPNRSLRMAILVTAGFVLAAAGLSFLRVDDDFIRYFESDVPFRADVERMSKLGVGSPYHIEITLESPDNSSAISPEYLTYSRSLVQRLRSDSQILNVTSITDVIDEVADLLEVSVEDAFSNSEIANQLFLAYELGLPVENSSTSFIDATRTKLRFSVLLKDVSSKQTQDIEAEIYKDHELNGPKGSRILVTGENIPVSHLSSDNISDMLAGVGPVIAVVAFLFAVLTRQALLFGVGLFAIAVPIASGFGIWGWAFGEIGLAATIVLAITIGVVIDDAIHILYRFEDSRSDLGLSSVEAASYAVHKAGPAVVITSVCLSLGFALLVFSSYAVNQVFGLIACIIFVLAMLFDLIVLPKLLAWRRLA